MMRLLSDHWDDLSILERIAREHPDFRSFVLQHIDSTAGTKDLERARDQSSRRCPPGLHLLCKDISAAAKAALR